MTDVQPWLSAAAAVPAENGRVGASRDGGHDGDLHAVWKGVFENARPVDQGRAPASGLVARPGGADQPAWRDIASGPMSSGPRQSETRVGAPPAEPATAQVPDSAVVSVGRQRDERSADRPAGLLQGIGTSADAMRSGRSGPRGGTAAAVAPPQQQPQPQPRAPSATPSESVVVYLQAASVSIVLRDGELSQSQALQCAFEASHQLTGRRSALRLLVLNGRTVYGPSDPPTSPAPATTTLVFSC